MGYDQEFKIDIKHKNEIYKFLRFLKRLLLSYPTEFFIEYSFNKKTRNFYIRFDGKRGVLDCLLQSLFIDKILYYYCLQSRNKDTIAILSKFIVKICNNDNCFGRGTLNVSGVKKFLNGMDFDYQRTIPTHNVILSKFEILMRQWDIGSLEDEEFIILIDRCIENLLRDKCGVSPRVEFPKLLDKSENSELIDNEIRKSLEEIHKFRNKIIHHGYQLKPKEKRKIKSIVWGEPAHRGTPTIPLFSYIDGIDSQLCEC